MDRGAWWAAVHGVSKSQTHLSDFTFTFHFYALEKEMKVKVAQSCLTLCDPMAYIVHEILQARILEWVVVFLFSRGSSLSRD